MAAGGAAYTGNFAGAAIGDGGTSYHSGAEVEPETTELYDIGFIEYYDAEIDKDYIKDGTAIPYKTVKGKATPPKTITFDPNGGSCGTTNATTVLSNGFQVLGSLPIATRKDHSFDGWFTAKDGGERITETTAFTCDTTVYAHWTYNPPVPGTYTITFDANGGSVSPASGTTGTDGKLASLPTPSLEGYSFSGWFTEKDGGTEVTRSTVFSSNETI